jgi:hypothetical protein
MVVKPSTQKLPASSQAGSHIAPKPFHKHITLDLLLLILANSIFHPWITLVFYLCLASIHKHKTALAFYTLCYTGFLAVVELSIWANHRITYGKYRKVNWEDEVVVITGGGSGLGRTVAEMVMRKGGKVAVLDVLEADEVAQEEMERWDLVWEKVDVRDAEAVKKAMEKIVDEVSTLRFPLSHSWGLPADELHSLVRQQS